MRNGQWASLNITEKVYYVRFGNDGGKQQFVLVGKGPFVALDKLAEKQRWWRREPELPLPGTAVPRGASFESRPANRCGKEDGMSSVARNTTRSTSRFPAARSGSHAEAQDNTTRGAADRGCAPPQGTGNFDRFCKDAETIASEDHRAAPEMRYLPRRVYGLQRYRARS
ncbi:MAG: hypothetical protein WAM78_22980 [Candidatus Sulfotelmatobacter sp.]